MRIFFTVLVILLAHTAHAQAFQKTECAISPRAAYDRLTSQAQQKQQKQASQLININTASVAELTQLPKIGVKKAQAIVDYRRQHGAFTSVDDLTMVKGIGKKTVETFHYRLTIQ